MPPALAEKILLACIETNDIPLGEHEMVADHLMPVGARGSRNAEGSWGGTGAEIRVHRAEIRVHIDGGEAMVSGC
ncbi:hypothetical protein BH24ACT19_BH24ACT19_20650 [soil metagenome]